MKDMSERVAALELSLAQERQNRSDLQEENRKLKEQLAKDDLPPVSVTVAVPTEIMNQLHRVEATLDANSMTTLINGALSRGRTFDEAIADAAQALDLIYNGDGKPKQGLDS